MVVRNNVAAEFNTGRMNFFTSDEASKYIEAYQYQAILDDGTTEFCAAHNNQVLLANDPQLGQITPPNHHGCRSTLVAILIGESEAGGYFNDYKNKFEPFGADVPAEATKPATGFGG